MTWQLKTNTPSARLTHVLHHEFAAQHFDGRNCICPLMIVNSNNAWQIVAPLEG